MKPEEERAIRKLFNSNKAEQYKSFTGAWNGALIAVLKILDDDITKRYGGIDEQASDYDNFLARQMEHNQP